MADLESNLEFLAGLDKRLHEVKPGTLTANLWGSPSKVYYDKYTDEKLTVDEVERVLNIYSSNDNLVFYPINTAMGCSVGFVLQKVDEKKPLLVFIERQLPPHYHFHRLSEYFMQPENVEKARKIEVRIENDYGKYEY